MEGLCEIALPILTVWPRAWIHSSTMGHVFSLQTATSYPLLFVCLFPGKSAGLISGPVQGKHITSLAVLTTLSLPALVRIQQAVSWGLGRGPQDGSDRLGSFLGAEQEHDSKEIRFPRLSVLLRRCGNPLVCESPTGSFPSVFSLYQACRASKRRTHRPSGRAVLHHVESKRQMKGKKVNAIPVVTCSGQGDSHSHCDPHNVQTLRLDRTPFTPFRSPFSRLSRGKEMMLFIF